jgi:hypothetical protein
MNRSQIIKNATRGNGSILDATVAKKEVWQGESFNVNLTLGNTTRWTFIEITSGKSSDGTVGRNVGFGKLPAGWFIHNGKLYVPPQRGGRYNVAIDTEADVSSRNNKAFLGLLIKNNTWVPLGVNIKQSNPLARLEAISRRPGTDGTLVEGGKDKAVWNAIVSHRGDGGSKVRFDLVRRGNNSASDNDVTISSTTRGVTYRDGYFYVPRNVTSFDIVVTARRETAKKPANQYKPGHADAEGTEKATFLVQGHREQVNGNEVLVSVNIQENERLMTRNLLLQVKPALHGNLDGDVWAYRKYQEESWFQQIKNDKLFKYVNENDPDELKRFFGAASVRDISKNYTVEDYLERLKAEAAKAHSRLITAQFTLRRDTRKIYDDWLSPKTVIGTQGSLPDVGAREYLLSLNSYLKGSDRELTGGALSLRTGKIEGESILGRAGRLLDSVALADMPENFDGVFTDMLKAYTKDLSAAFMEIAFDMKRLNGAGDWNTDVSQALEMVRSIASIVTKAGIAVSGGAILAGAAVSTRYFEAYGDTAQSKARRVSDEMAKSIDFDTRAFFSRIARGERAGVAGEYLVTSELGSETKAGLVDMSRYNLDGSVAMQNVFAEFGDMASELFTFMESTIVNSLPSSDGPLFFQEFRNDARPDTKEYALHVNRWQGYGEQQNRLYMNEEGNYFWKGENWGRRADQNGKIIEGFWAAKKYYVPNSWFDLAPVVLDLDGDGFTFTSLAASAASYDANGDGDRERIAWVGKRDGILSYDKNDDGLISATDEISFVGYREGAKTDLEGLVAFDTNANGKLDAGDAQWGRFKVWTDTNGDGISDHGELVSLDEAGIASISLVSDKIQYEENDVTVFGIAEVERVDGTKINAADAAFAYKPNALDARLLQLKAAIAGMAPAGQGPGSVTQEAYQRTLVGAIAAA